MEETLHEEFKINQAINKKSFADSKENIDNSQSTLIDYIHNEFLEAQRKNEKAFDEFKEDNSKQHQYIIDCKEKDHCAIGIKIDRSIKAAVAANQTGRKELKEAMEASDKKFENMSKEILDLKLKDASFYGKMFIISFLVGTGITLFLTKFWSDIVDLIYKK